MSLLDRILISQDKPPCLQCKHLIWQRPELPFCKTKDKIILPDYPPTVCDKREVEDK